MLNGNRNIRHQLYWSGFVYYLSKPREVESGEKHNPKQSTQQLNTRCTCLGTLICCTDCLLPSAQFQSAWLACLQNTNKSCNLYKNLTLLIYAYTPDLGTPRTFTKWSWGNILYFSGEGHLGTCKTKESKYYWYLKHLFIVYKQSLNCTEFILYPTQLPCSKHHTDFVLP